MDIGAADSKVYSYEKEAVRTTPAPQTPKSNTTQKATTTAPKTNTTKPSTTTTEILVARAQQIALGKTGGGTVTKYHVDYENGRKAYDITIVNGNTEYDLEIGASNSVVYSFEKEVIRTATTPKASANTKPSTSTKPNTGLNFNSAAYYDDDDRYDDDKYDDDDDRYDND